MDLGDKGAKLLDEIGALPNYTAEILDLIVVDGKAEAKGSNFHSDAENIVRKSLMHFGTLIALSHRCSLKLKGGTFQYVDFATANCLSRIIFEGCVLLAYVFKAPNKIDREFWHSVWRLDGHLERRKHLDAPSKDDPPKLVKELYPEDLKKNESAISALEVKIKAHPYFAGLNMKQQKRAINGKWREVENLDKLKYEELATRAGLDLHFGKSAYSFTSTYIHTTAISIYQVHEAKTMEAQLRLHAGALKMAAGFHMVCLETYASLYSVQAVEDAAKQRLSKLPLLKEYISK